MTFNFTPTGGTKRNTVEVPFWEDARSDRAPYRDIRYITVYGAQRQVESEFAKLDALRVSFSEGYFGDEPNIRYGFQVDFVYLGADARMVVAGLPIRGTVTDTKIMKVQIQALFNLRDWLKVMFTKQVFTPGTYPLMQYLLVENGTKTVGQLMIEEKLLHDINPMLPSGGK